MKNKFPVVVGGNHTVSIGAAKAFSGHYNDLSVLQLDAHSDLRQEYEGSAMNHACVMARIREFAPIVQVGIRSMAREESVFMLTAKGYFFPMNYIMIRQITGRQLTCFQKMSI